MCVCGVHKVYTWRGVYDVCVRHLVGEVVVDDDVNPLDVDASAEQICGHQDALVELLGGREKGRGWGEGE